MVYNRTVFTTLKNVREQRDRTDMQLAAALSRVVKSEWGEFERKLLKAQYRMKQTATKWLGIDWALADDIVQEANARAWKSRETYFPDSDESDKTFGSWMVGIMRNALHDHYRRHRNTKEILIDVGDNDSELDGEDPRDNIFDRQQAPDNQHKVLEFKEALALISRLPEMQRKSMELVARGYEPVEVQNEIGGNARLNIFKARQKLEEMSNGKVQGASERDGRVVRLPNKVLNGTGSRGFPGNAPDLMAAVQVPSRLGEDGVPRKESGMKQVSVPADSVLLNAVSYAFQCHPGPILQGWTPGRRKVFWDYVANYYPEFHNYMKWYGDEGALEKRLFEKYKSGKTA